MEHKFGIFNTVEELNRAAAGQRAEGDEESLIALALENGLDKEDAEDYMDGVTEELATPLMAAYGRLKVEFEELKVCEIMEDWIEYIKIQCAEDGDMVFKVFSPEKSLQGCIAELLKWSFANQYEVSKEITKAAGVTAGKCTLGIPGMARAKQIIKKYYLGK